jgi:thioredoxin-related protein
LLAALLAMTCPFAAVAAELVMFERAGCSWCAAFNREIAPVFAKTSEGARAPLRRVDIRRPIPTDLKFIVRERITPIFVLVEDGHEIGRIRGYPGEDHFWGLLGALLDRLDQSRMSDKNAELKLHNRIPLNYQR